MKIYIDGKYYDKESAMVSVYDHGFLYGDGVFEGLRIYGAKVFKLKEHLKRLYTSAKAIALNIPMDMDEMEKAVIEAVRTNERTDGYVRLIVTRGKGPLGIDPFQCASPTIIIIVDSISLYPARYYEFGIEVITASTRRIPPECLDPRIKSLNYLNNILAKIEAHQAGCLEAVMLNIDGYVAECTADNVFIVNGEHLCTPPVHAGALDGITRKTVMELAHESGLKVTALNIAKYDLYAADECFITGTGAEILPVIKVDGRTIGSGAPGRITTSLIERFRLLCK